MQLGAVKLKKKKTHNFLTVLSICFALRKGKEKTFFFFLFTATKGNKKKNSLFLFFFSLQHELTKQS